MKLLWCDIESGGFSDKKSALLEVAIIPVIDGEEKEPFVSLVAPFDGAEVSPGALKVNGFDKDAIYSHPPEKKVIVELVEYLEKFDCAFTLAGHNVAFDVKFIREFFYRNGYGSTFDDLFRPNTLCTFIKAQKRKKHIKSKLNLGALCEYFHIPLEDAHSALPDIQATIKLNDCLDTMLAPYEEDTASLTYTEKKAKYLWSKYVVIEHDGNVWIRPSATSDKNAMRFIMEELMDIYLD